MVRHARQLLSEEMCDVTKKAVLRSLQRQRLGMPQNRAWGRHSISVWDCRNIVFEVAATLWLGTAAAYHNGS